MTWCPGCGGVVGRDCFNPQECEWIAQDMARRAEGDRWREEEAAYHREQEAAYHTSVSSPGRSER